MVWNAVEHLDDAGAAGAFVAGAGQRGCPPVRGVEDRLVRSDGNRAGLAGDEPRNPASRRPGRRSWHGSARRAGHPRAMRHRRPTPSIRRSGPQQYTAVSARGVPRTWRRSKGPWRSWPRSAPFPHTRPVPWQTPWSPGCARHRRAAGPGLRVRAGGSSARRG